MNSIRVRTWPLTRVWASSEPWRRRRNGHGGRTSTRWSTANSGSGGGTAPRTVLAPVDEVHVHEERARPEHLDAAVAARAAQGPQRVLARAAGAQQRGDPASGD